MERLMTAISLALRQRHVLFLVALLCLLALGLAEQASAAGWGAFSPTGSMTVPRSEAAAAPLPGGRVLVVGGYYYDNSPPYDRYLSSAEIFNPATNSFSSTGIGSMSVPTVGAAAAPLPDGRVLVARGTPVGVSSSDWPSAEVFDPATNSFSSAGIGSMSVPRSGAVAAPLPDGRVLVAGGFSDRGPMLSTAEIFNPATNSFSSAGIGLMSVPRVGAAGAPLPDGRVLVVGGDDDSFHTLSSAEVFDPATRRFSSAGIGSMSRTRYEAAAAPLPDGRVLVAGGILDPSALYGCYLSSAEVFDPASNSFSSEGIGSMSVPRADAIAAPLPGGVLVAGGYYGADFLGRGCPTTAACEAPARAEIFALGVPPAPPATCSRPAPAPPATSATCRGRQATIVGSDGADQITGTGRADVIVGLGGTDKLSGLAGKDVICGAKGSDTLKGGAGNDQLSGQKGNDKLYGQKGNDKLSGKGGSDTLKGGPGKDILKGGPGKDKLVQ
jgi:RTX calcium-binding nonapeptide repeat (4 copies)/Kelch motif